MSASCSGVGCVLGHAGETQLVEEDTKGKWQLMASQNLMIEAGDGRWSHGSSSSNSALALTIILIRLTRP